MFIKLKDQIVSEVKIVYYYYYDWDRMIFLYRIKIKFIIEIFTLFSTYMHSTKLILNILGKTDVRVIIVLWDDSKTK